MRTRSAILICAVVLLAGPGSAQTTFGIFSPLNPQNISGYQGPFLWDNTQAPSVRYQQVYRNSDFPRMGGTPVLINEVSFDTSAAAINVSLANVQVDLSTTSAQPDGLSTTFSQNVGRDDSIVFSGPLHLQTSGFGAYEAHIFLQHPFYYDPSMGNILLDVRNYQTIAPRLFPFLFLSSDDIGDTSSHAISLDVNATTAQFSGTAALLTRFDGVIVPEPSTLLLFAAGISFWFVIQALRKKGMRLWR